MRAIAFIILLTAFISCKKNKPTPVVLQGNAFGTTYVIKYFGGLEETIQQKVDSVIYVVNRSMSTYIYDSDISKINRGDAIKVDHMFAEVFTISQQIYNETQHYFDPTVGVLRNAYGFGDKAALEQLDRPTIDSLMHYVGFDKVVLNEDNIIIKKHPQIYLDFNAIAKGYGIDRIGLSLESQGIENYLIELGGELRANGINLQKQKPWVVAIEQIDSQLENRTYQATLILDNKAMASSGNYRKFWIDSLTGKRFVHTINPITGKAEAANVTSATVVAFNCTLADAYATSFMAMGLERSKALLNSLKGIEAYLTYVDEAGEAQVFMTAGFRALLLDL